MGLILQVQNMFGAYKTLKLLVNFNVMTPSSYPVKKIAIKNSSFYDW